jgi:hypothetical protein
VNTYDHDVQQAAVKVCHDGFRCMHHMSATGVTHACVGKPLTSNCCSAGVIDDSIYEDNCAFVDPTVRFQGKDKLVL